MKFNRFPSLRFARLCAFACALLLAGCELFFPTDFETNQHQPIVVAAERGDAAKVAGLLDKKPAQISVAWWNGDTLLHLAAAKGNADVVKVLLERGAQVNAVDDAADTPLHLAAQKGSVETARILIEHGAAVNKKNNNGETPLLRAEAWGREDVQDLLISNGGTE